MSKTVKEFLEGSAVVDISRGIRTINDAVDYLSNYNRQVTDKTKIDRIFGADGNSIEIVDEYSNPAAASEADEFDREYTEENLTMTRHGEITLRIGEESFYKYQGLNFGALSMPMPAQGSDKFKIIQGMYFSLADEVARLIRKAKQYERNQISTFLDELGVSSDPFVLPFGKQLVADSRTDFWNFDNKGTTALDTTEFKKLLNIFAKQVDIEGHEIGDQGGVAMLLHAYDVALCNDLMFPANSVNTLNRTPNDILNPTNAKMTGTYKTADTTDWVAFSRRFIEEGFLRRITHQYYTYADKAGQIIADGFKLSIFPLEDENCIKIKLKMKSQIAVETPEGIFKAIVAN